MRILPAIDDSKFSQAITQAVIRQSKIIDVAADWNADLIKRSTGSTRDSGECR
jgi:hypothetical protein